ncbi:DUF6284 family protein [Streptomyces pathocidini]|uniref:DUF6284 family protein n=1 Tax=Streptomyces pathocidini TaxID=1650571 RepID=A0ABW7UZB6_9ACTN|nr:DUF6284 family protein [Streptomyces pathocidini]
MDPIVTVQDAVTAFADWKEPTACELALTSIEMPLIRAEVDLLDAQIAAMDRVPNEVDARRVRRARNRVLAARRELVNSSASRLLPGGAA